MVRRILMPALAAIVAISVASSAIAGLNTATYVDSSNGAVNNAGFIPTGYSTAVGDGAGVGDSSVTLMDIDGGDMWNGGDQFIYLHDSAQEAGDFTATVRVVSQTEATAGRWGKAGIHARSTLDGNSANAMAQLANGNGSQLAGESPVPVRLAGRTQNDGQGGFENGIIAAAGSEQDLLGAEVANNTFTADGTVATWLSLTYTKATNSFVAGTAKDLDGTPGVWSYSSAVDNVPSDGDWYVGLAYSMHNDQVGTDNMLGVTYDNWSINQIPEPSTLTLLGLALAGFVGLARRRR